MIDRHVRNLRLDRRLAHRRGWISAQDMDEALEGLPDVAEKAELVTDESDSPDPAPAEPAADPVVPPPSADPFGTH